METKPRRNLFRQKIRNELGKRGARRGKRTDALEGNIQDHKLDKSQYIQKNESRDCDCSCASDDIILFIGFVIFSIISIVGDILIIYVGFTSPGDPAYLDAIESKELTLRYGEIVLSFFKVVSLLTVGLHFLCDEVYICWGLGIDLEWVYYGDAIAYVIAEIIQIGFVSVMIASQTDGRCTKELEKVIGILGENCSAEDQLCLDLEAAFLIDGAEEDRIGLATEYVDEHCFNSPRYTFRSIGLGLTFAFPLVGVGLYILMEGLWSPCYDHCRGDDDDSGCYHFCCDMTFDCCKDADNAPPPSSSSGSYSISSSSSSSSSGSSNKKKHSSTHHNSEEESEMSRSSSYDNAPPPRMEPVHEKAPLQRETEE